MGFACTRESETQNVTTWLDWTRQRLAWTLRTWLWEVPQQRTTGKRTRLRRKLVSLHPATTVGKVRAIETVTQMRTTMHPHAHCSASKTCKHLLL
jgi:hypothetical protein